MEFPTPALSAHRLLNAGIELATTRVLGACEMQLSYLCKSFVSFLTSTESTEDVCFLAPSPRGLACGLEFRALFDELTLGMNFRTLLG